MEEDIQKIIESLNPTERKILPYLREGNIEDIEEQTNLDKVGIHRALEFLSNKGIIKLNYAKAKIIELGINGLLYKKKELPERRLMHIISEKSSISLKEAQKISKLNDNEFKVAIGVLKKKALINIINENIIFSGTKKELVEKTFEEKLLEILPKSYDELKDEEKLAFENLKSRKNIIDVQIKTQITFELTDLGKKLIVKDLVLDNEMIESLTPSMIKSNAWKGKKFRRYDITSPVPKINGGKTHFVNQATEYAKKIWLELGFKEMTGDLTTTGFWNFDALFTAQDHPVREIQDTFFIKNKTGKIIDEKLAKEIKKAHEGLIPGSKGWEYEWNIEEAKKILLRTHTTCLSVRTLKQIAENKEFPAKYFALGKCFRNETVDWSHGFEFYQTEGIVIDENANFRQLIGYLKEFYRKMGYTKIRIRPGYFPYTEPSLEVDVFHPVKQKWVELGGAGMFRPELTIPIFGKHIPVLAWGQGMDRIIMEIYNITDLRQMYANDINHLRNVKYWSK